MLWLLLLMTDAFKLALNEIYERVLPTENVDLLLLLSRVQQKTHLKMKTRLRFKTIHTVYYEGTHNEYRKILPQWLHLPFLSCPTEKGSSYMPPPTIHPELVRFI